MKFSVAPEQKGFFQEKGEIEFEDLLKPEELLHLQNSIREALALKLARSQAVDKKRPEESYLAGRDLWRSCPALKKIIGLRRLGEIATQLVDVKILRLGYDQYFPSPKQTTSALPESYHQMLQDTKTLQSYGSVQGVLCGLMLCLNANPEIPARKHLSIFSTTPGNGVFFRPTLPVDFSDLYSHIGCDYFLIVYANVKSVYTLNREDLHSRDWIGIGYDFGDKLSDELHPIVFR